MSSNRMASGRMNSAPAPAAGQRRPYKRSMDGWWRRDPWFSRYMIRELTALIVAFYAVVLLIGVVRLAQGELEFTLWLAGMKTPASIVGHIALLIGFIYHTWSWFEIMPKTMPPVVIGGKKVPPAAIIGAGLVAAVIATIVVLAIAMMLAGRARS